MKLDKKKLITSPYPLLGKKNKILILHTIIFQNPMGLVHVDEEISYKLGKLGA